MAKIIHERFKCIGCAACTAVCPDFFEMAEDGKAKLKGGKDTGNETFELEIKEIKCAKEAESVCPVQCIHVKE